jgi:DNA repair protein RecO (recombination protein O)
MIHKTRGIVLRFIKFRETSIIVTILTDKFGVQSYIVNGVRSKKSQNKIALYQPLTLLNLVVYHREQANIERIKEVQCLHPFSSLITNVKKSSVCLFITEVINKAIREESQTGEVFNFIADSLIAFDSMDEGFENFHLLFLLKLSRYLGFGIHNVNEVVGGQAADEATETLISKLLNANYADHVSMSNTQRRNVLDIIVRFYSDHMEQLREIKSLAVLKEVMQ